MGYLEPRAAEVLGHFLHVDGIAQIRLVGTESGHRLRIGKARPIPRHALAAGELFEDAGDHRFHRRKHVGLLDKAHLDVELVELARQAVGARILVAEARRDLKIAIEAGDHDELLVDLRRLRQGVELAFVKARGHQKVARAFG